MADSLIGSLRVALSLGTAEFEAGANKAVAIARSKSKQIESSFAGAKAAVAGLFAAFTVGLLAEQIKKSLDYAGSLREVASTLGLTTTQLQQFRYVASQTGVSQDKLELGLRKLTESMGKAEAGSQKQIKAFKAIGISVEQLKGMNTGDTFLRLADGVSKYSDRAARAAVETALMSRSGSLLDNALKGGSARINELSEAASRLGIVLSSSAIAGAEETAHKLEAVKMVLSAQIAGVVANNAGAILSLSSALATLTGSIIRFLGSNPQLALGIVGALLGGRVGGLPGAVIGGAAGAIFGGKLAQSALDANPDLTVRTQQMRAAQQAFAAAQQGTPGPHGEMFAPEPGTVNAAKSEFIRQIHLLQQATGQARSNALPTSPNLPQFLAGNDKKPKKGPKDKNEEDEFQFAQAQRQADLEILQAKQQLSHDYVEQTTISIAMLDIEKAIKDAEIDHKVAQAKRDFAEGKITAATLDEIVSQVGIAKAKEATLDHLKRQAVLEAEQEQRFKDVAELDSVRLNLKKQHLQDELALATTAKRRRDLELQILDLDYQDQKAKYETVLADTQASDKAKEEARLGLLQLTHDQGLKRQDVLQQTRGPLDQYLAGLPTTADKWKEALQGVAVDGFGVIESAADKLAGKIVKVGGIFGDVTRTIIADLLKIELQKMIIAPLVNALSGLLGGSANFGSAGLLNTLSPVSVSGVTPVTSAPGFATGGSMRILGNMGIDRNTLSLNGTPIARVSHGEDVSIGQGGGSRIVINQTIAPNFAGNAATKDDLMQMAILTKSATISAINERNRRR